MVDELIITHHRALVGFPVAVLNVSEHLVGASCTAARETSFCELLSLRRVISLDEGLDSGVAVVESDGNLVSLVSHDVS